MREFFNKHKNALFIGLAMVGAYLVYRLYVSKQAATAMSNQDAAQTADYQALLNALSAQTLPAGGTSTSDGVSDGTTSTPTTPNLQGVTAPDINALLQGSQTGLSSFSPSPVSAPQITGTGQVIPSLALIPTFNGTMSGGSVPVTLPTSLTSLQAYPVPVYQNAPVNPTPNVSVPMSVPSSQIPLSLAGPISANPSSSFNFNQNNPVTTMSLIKPSTSIPFVSGPPNGLVNNANPAGTAALGNGIYSYTTPSTNFNDFGPSNLGGAVSAFQNSCAATGGIYDANGNCDQGDSLVAADQENSYLSSPAYLATQGGVTPQQSAAGAEHAYCATNLTDAQTLGLPIDNTNCSNGLPVSGFNYGVTQGPISTVGPILNNNPVPIPSTLNQAIGQTLTTVTANA